MEDSAPTQCHCGHTRNIQVKSSHSNLHKRPTSVLRCTCIISKIGFSTLVFSSCLLTLLITGVESRSVPGPVMARHSRHSKATALEEKTLHYLAKFGYLNGPNRETASLLRMSKSDFKNALKKLQKMGGIPQTGNLDSRTRTLMVKPRCGVEDYQYGPDLSDYRRRRKRYKLGPSRWSRTNLTFRIENYTPDMKMTNTRASIYKAIKVWNDASQLSFSEVMHGRADMMIKFANRFHNDSYPFDGKGLVLAHAFFPGKDRGGDVHFDEDEYWTYGNSDKGVNLFMAAAHEFGHSLGLSHSPEPSALMYAWYQGYQENFVLPHDDREAIQHLYGPPTNKILPDFHIPTVDPSEEPHTPDIGPDTGGSIPVTERPRQRTTTRPHTPWDPDETPNPCKDPIDAINILRQEIMFFIGNWMWRMDLNKQITQAPTTIHGFWHSLPTFVDHIDAFYERRTDHKIIFFSGNRYWVLDANDLETHFPQKGRSLTNLGIPSDIKKIDAVFVWGYNSRTYIISGDMYWKMNENDSYVEFDYPRDMKIWNGVKVPVSTAFQDKNGKTYFFQGKYYSEFYDMRMQLAKGWPKLVAKHFLKTCQTGNSGPEQHRKSPNKIQPAGEIEYTHAENGNKGNGGNTLYAMNYNFLLFISLFLILRLQ